MVTVFLVLAGSCGRGGTGTVSAAGASEPASQAGSSGSNGGSASNAATESNAGNAEAPTISGVDRSFLTTHARRTLTGLVSGQLYQAGYVPPDLKNRTCRVGVTLWADGRFLSEGVSEVKPVLAACEEGLHTAFDSLPDPYRTAEGIGRVRIEIELLSGLRELGCRANDRAALAREVVIGLDGLAMRRGERLYFVRPSIWRAENMTVGLATWRLLKQTGVSPEERKHFLGEARLYRFRTTQWVEPAEQSVPPVLRWGVRPVPLGEVTKENLAASIRTAGQYLLYRQNPEGVFAYEFEPAKDAYVARDDWVHQAGAMWTLSRYAKFTGQALTTKAANKCIQAFGRLLTPIPKRPHAMFVMLPGGPNKVGLTALYLLSIMDHPEPEPYYFMAARIVSAILGQQQKDGRLLADFPTGALKSSQTEYPAEALLALTRVLEVRSNDTVKAALARALPFYYEYFQEHPSTLFVAWQSLCYGSMARLTRERRYADFVFEMIDPLVEHQLTEVNCVWEELRGALAVPGTPPATIRTGLYLMGLAEAMKTARAFGDQARARRYERAVRLGTRFVMQLQFRREECYYVRSPRDVVGGFRTSLTDNVLRLDGQAWGLGGLLSAWDGLYGGAKTASVSR